MKVVLCPTCKRKAKKFGKTRAGTQRFRCETCKLTFTHSYSTKTKDFQEFLKWLLGKLSQEEMTRGGRAFRRRCSEFWGLWALPDYSGEIYDVVYVDGIHIARDLVVLIASTGEHVIGWYVAQSENSFAWAALLGKIAPPRMVVMDGSPGFAKAAKLAWPETRIQRCLVHVAEQVKRYTTRKPNLPAGKELLELARRLSRIKDMDAAVDWIVEFNSWCARWKEFLAERTRNPDTGKYEWTHARLVRARNSLTRLVRSKTLFTYLDEELVEDIAKLPSTNNRAESINARIREMLRLHRGLSKLRRVKAVFWWCYMHSECPLDAQDILERMPTDDQVDRLFEESARRGATRSGSKQWGDALVWEELRQVLPWRDEWSM